MNPLLRVLKYGIGPGAKERRKAEKARKRKEAFESELWQREGGLAKRRYSDYDEYLDHQAHKLGNIEERLRAREAEDLEIFTERFRTCEALAGARNVLCLAARIGTEVRALLDLGYFAVGIDLNPGQDNPYVVAGDFHALVFPDASVDAVYTNSLDHVFDLEKVVAEVVRVLAPGGILITDVLEGWAEGFVAGEYEATHWEKVEPFVQHLAELGGLELVSVRDPGRMRENEKLRDRVLQAVLRKPAA
ncbi:MAG: class I SAM-dependent methyltransferase [Myxococcota bacterium]